MCSLAEKESVCSHQIREYSDGVFSFLYILRDEDIIFGDMIVLSFVKSCRVCFGV